MKNKILLLTLIYCLMLIFCSKFSFAKEKVYQPYPIVFVSGIGSNPDIKSKDYPGNGTWAYILSEYNKFYFDGHSAKYFFDSQNLFKKEYPYLEFLVYDGSAQAITLSAKQLKDKINNVLQRYYTDKYSYTYPCNQKKVILVCHSMGGLIAREAIRKYSDLKDKIAFITFIGTPHLGSSNANMAYFISEDKKKLDMVIGDIEKLITVEHGFQKQKYKNLLVEIQNIRNGDEKFIKWARKDLNIECSGDAIKDMRLPFNNANSYNHTISYAQEEGSKFYQMSFDVKIPSYDEKETFLYQLLYLQGKNLGIPDDKVFSIVGTNMSLKWGIYLVLNWYLPGYFRENDFSCVANGYYNDGDGTVPLFSERYLINNTIGNGIEIDRSHTSVYFLNIKIKPLQMFKGEYDYPDTPKLVLSHIDPKPIIASMKVVPQNYYSNINSLSIYVIPKINEYLLADIDITEMKLDEANIRPEAFFIAELEKDNFTGDIRTEIRYKPYVDKTLGKDFLKSRKDLNIKDRYGITIPLNPGEFYVPATLNDNSLHELKIKVKNPAEKVAEASIFIQRPNIDNILPVGRIDDKRPTISAKIWTGSTEIYDEGVLNGNPVIKTKLISIDKKSVLMTLSGPNTSGEIIIDPILTEKITTVFDPIKELYLEYTPTSDLAPGTYTVKVNGSDMWGLPAQEKTWTFEIPGERPPVICEEEPTTTIDDQTPTISARAFSPDGIDIDLNSISMSVDGYGGGFTVSPSTGGSNITITHNSEKLDYGSHNVNLSLRDKAGQSASKSWSFTIKNPNAFFEVSVPGTISRDTDFTMTVTAKNPDGTPLNTYGEPIK